MLGLAVVAIFAAYELAYRKQIFSSAPEIQQPELILLERHRPGPSRERLELQAVEAEEVLLLAEAE